MGLQRVRHDWATSISLFTFHFHTLEKEMATHSSVLAWKIPGTGEPGGLPSMGSHRIGQDWRDLAAAADLAILIYINQFQFITVVIFFFFFCCYIYCKLDSGCSFKLKWLIVRFWHNSYWCLITSLWQGALCCAVCCAQSCLTLCDPMDCSLPGPSVHGISQARILEWLPFPSPEHLPDPGIEPVSPALAGRFFTTEPSLKPTRVS